MSLLYHKVHIIEKANMLLFNCPYDAHLLVHLYRTSKLKDVGLIENLQQDLSALRVTTVQITLHRYHINA